MKKKPKNKTYSFSDKKIGAQTTGFEQGEIFPQVVPACFTDEELEQLMQVVIAEGQPATVSRGANKSNTEFRRSDVAWLNDDKYSWVYDRIWEIVTQVNKKYRFHLKEFHDPIQIAAYPHTEEGFYCWHLDISPLNMRRKLSITMPLNSPSEYEGGDLEISFGKEPWRAPQGKGNVIVFPSFALHRVSPVTKGTRYSLVAWVGGSDFR